jgi:hypothetical protein
MVDQSVSPYSEAIGVYTVDCYASAEIYHMVALKRNMCKDISIPVPTTQDALSIKVDGLRKVSRLYTLRGVEADMTF